MNFNLTGCGSHYLSEDISNLFCDLYEIQDIQEVGHWITIETQILAQSNAILRPIWEYVGFMHMKILLM